MQIIEKNSFNVRSSFFKLKNNESNISFLLLPIVHIGSVDYYKNISKILDESNFIIYEGVNSKKGRLLTLTYRIVKKMKRLNLITQFEGINYKKYKNKLIWNDINKKDFENSWSNLSIIFRFLLFIILPIYILFFFIIGTKQYIAKNMNLEDLPSSQDIEYKSIDDNFNKIDDIIIKKRDKIIIENINEFYLNNKEKDLKVVLLYGAKHILSIIKYLYILKYRIVSSSWIKIFDL